MPALGNNTAGNPLTKLLAQLRVSTISVGLSDLSACREVGDDKLHIAFGALEDDLRRPADPDDLPLRRFAELAEEGIVQHDANASMPSGDPCGPPECKACGGTKMLCNP